MEKPDPKRAAAYKAYARIHMEYPTSGMTPEASAIDWLAATCGTMAAKIDVLVKTVTKLERKLYPKKKPARERNR